MIMDQPTALVVEDDEGIRETLHDLLEIGGYTVREAADGETALAILRASPTGLVVLLDNLLPGVSGMEALAELERDGADSSARAAPARTAPDTGAREQRLIDRHSYVVITASPQRITPAQHAQLSRLRAPVIAKPFDIVTLMAAVDDAARRLSP